jgi:plasmid maintenance system killer protein
MHLKIRCSIWPPVDSAASLMIAAANRFEALKAGRAVQHSIRINDQCICFVWKDGHAHAVEIVDLAKERNLPTECSEGETNK